MSKYNLKVDPRILELLGPNLYTNIYYVLAELIANAYDADAKNVYLYADDNVISIEDDGHGMSYKNGETEKFLNVGGLSRNSSHDSKTKSGTRMKMGRKGIGKLASLSVSQSVDILTTSQGEKSGFVLKRKPNKDGSLDEIPLEEINFKYIKDQGTLIRMNNPHYSLHKNINSIKRNLLKIFPIVSDDFRIHISIGGKQIVIDDFEIEMMDQLCGLITLGSDFSDLAGNLSSEVIQETEKLVDVRDEISGKISFDHNEFELGEYLIAIKGWLGVYKTTRNRKKERTDFPDNFISLIANKKMGEFNCLPIVGQNKLDEVFVVGQLHIDLFEETSLPDMALSNRQGYKSDDPRYQFVQEKIQKVLLPDILKIRANYSALKKEKEQTKILKQKENDEIAFMKSIEDFKRSLSRELNFREPQNPKTDEEIVETKIDETINAFMPKLGLKSKIDNAKKQILLSHTLRDKPFADIIYSVLLYNGIPPEKIIYSNCDDIKSRIPEGYGIFKYLKTFFMDSYSDTGIYVIFATSSYTMESWGVSMEMGASWLAQMDHKIFNLTYSPYKPGTKEFTPASPLDSESVWQMSLRCPDDDSKIWVDKLNASIFYQKIEAICNELHYKPKSEAANTKYLSSLIEIC